LIRSREKYRKGVPRAGGTEEKNGEKASKALKSMDLTKGGRKKGMNYLPQDIAGRNDNPGDKRGRIITLSSSRSGRGRKVK